MKPLTERRRRSARETFAKCRKRYEAEYLNDEDMSSEATRRGQCWHLAREIMVKGLWKLKRTDDADIAAYSLKTARIGTPGLTFEEWMDLESLWARWVPNFKLNLNTFYSVEGEQPCYDTVLQYDQVDVPDADTLLIQDDKSHWRIISDAVLADNFQSAFYLAAARRIFPKFRRYAMVYNFVRYGTQSEPIIKTDAELDVIEQAIKESDEAMAAAELAHSFPATAGKHCGTCTLALNCSVSQKPNTTPSAMVEKVAWLDSARNQAVAYLRQLSESVGPISGGGYVWAHRPSERVGYPPDLVVDILREAGIPIPKYLMLSQSAVKGITHSKGKYASVALAVKALAVSKATSTTFSGKPIVPDEEVETPQEQE